MPSPLGGRRPSAPMVVSTIALFVSLGGAAYAANGGNFILGQSNSATNTTSLSAPVAGGSALRVVNNAAGTGSTALSLAVPNGRAPLTVNSDTRVNNLNADELDGLSSGVFLRRGLAASFAVDPSKGSAVVDVTNTGNGNGVQGKTNDGGGSGVYGEHIGPGGYGVAGRAGNSGHAIYGDNTGNGFAGYFEDRVHVGGDLEVGGSLSCTTATTCVPGSSVSGKVSDSDRLDGIDSGGFMQAFQGGSTDGQAVAMAPNTAVFVGPAIGGLVRLRYTCPSGIGGNGILRIMNASTGDANLFVDSGGANPDYVQLGSGGFIDYPASAGGESFFIQMQGSPGVASVQAATVHRAASNDCHAQALGVVAG